MGFGQSLSFLNACVAIGLSVLSPLAGHSRQSNKADNEIIVSTDDLDPGSQLAEHTESTIPSGKSKTPEGPSAEVEPDPSPSSGVALWTLLPFADLGKPTLIEKAYLDAYTILKEDNSCSRFYNGPSAISALNQLVRSLTPVYFNRTIALRITNPSIWIKHVILERGELEPRNICFHWVVPPVSQQTPMIAFPATKRSSMVFSS
jgi:hypothetical protein